MPVPLVLSLNQDSLIQNAVHISTKQCNYQVVFNSTTWETELLGLVKICQQVPLYLPRKGTMLKMDTVLEGPVQQEIHSVNGGWLSLEDRRSLHALENFLTSLFGGRYILQKSSQLSFPLGGWGSPGLTGTFVRLKNGVSASVKTLQGVGGRKVSILHFFLLVHKKSY